MVDVPTAQGDHRHRCVVLWDAGRRQDTGQDELLTVALAEDNKPREVQLGVCLHRLPYVLTDRFKMMF
ncbi:hypothetical protein WQ59_26580 [Streptomyces sp. KE1]|nr:hypothetical protein WQ59_26580 [Streptomyces sp. KE1]